MVLLIYGAYFLLPHSFRQHWGDAAFTALMCLGTMLYTSPQTYFRSRIPALGKRIQRNLVVNWGRLLISAGVAAAYAQHESATGRMIRVRGYVPRGIVFGFLLFWLVYFVLWLAYERVKRARRLRRLTTSA